MPTWNAVSIQHKRQENEELERLIAKGRLQMQ